MYRKLNKWISIITFQIERKIEVLKEASFYHRVIWSGSTFHTLAALDEKVFCPKPVLTMGSVILFLVAPPSSMRVAVFSQHKF